MSFKNQAGRILCFLFGHKYAQEEIFYICEYDGACFSLRIKCTRCGKVD
jgi:hypothetical protein